VFFVIVVLKVYTHIYMYKCTLPTHTLTHIHTHTHITGDNNALEVVALLEVQSNNAASAMATSVTGAVRFESGTGHSCV
jgi:hypothetical protein